MIPKIIHYCWFGRNEKTNEVVRMMDSWRKYCPDYEIKEWNEQNFNIHLNAYCEEAYEQRKWAFVSDVARLWALVHEGGIYMDTDVEVVRSLDSLLANHAFLGFEGTQWVGTNIIGAEPGLSFFRDFLESYNDRHFINENGTLNQTTNVEEITRRLTLTYGIRRNGQMQKLKDITVFPIDYFCPYDYINGRMKCTENTFSIHWYGQTWIKRSQLRTRLSQWWHRLCGVKMQ